MQLTAARQQRLRESLEAMSKDSRLQDPLKHSQDILRPAEKLTTREGNLIVGEKDGVRDGEHEMKKTVLLPDQAKRSYWWHEKYRPRKPKYFNKVKTGYSWNKYNQTHYDHDNPPPKIVQGYKFNIFYPDLIDPSKTPSYKVFEQT